MPGCSALGLRSGLREEHLTFSLYAHNVTNSRALTGAGFTQTTDGVTGARQVNITNLQPRTIAVGVDYAFSVDALDRCVIDRTDAGRGHVRLGLAVGAHRAH